jgi:hypothetical protein
VQQHQIVAARIALVVTGSSISSSETMPVDIIIGLPVLAI